MAKRCTGPCGRELPEEDFHFRSKAEGKRIARCRECAAQWAKNHYVQNKAMYVKKAGRWNRKNREEMLQRLLEYLAQYPCVDCGETDPIVLTFDHVRGTKHANVSDLMRGGHAWSTVEQEIAKCEVRCCNCHARKTAKDLRWRKILPV